MGFPYDTPTWDGVSGPIFMGYGGSMPAVISVIAIAVAIGVLVVGQIAEAKSYKKYK